MSLAHTCMSWFLWLLPRIIDFFSHYYPCSKSIESIFFFFFTCMYVINSDKFSGIRVQELLYFLSQLVEDFSSFGISQRFSTFSQPLKQARAPDPPICPVWASSPSAPSIHQLLWRRFACCAHNNTLNNSAILRSLHTSFVL